MSGLVFQNYDLMLTSFNEWSNANFSPLTTTTNNNNNKTDSTLLLFLREKPNQLVPRDSEKSRKLLNMRPNGAQMARGIRGAV